MQRARRALEKQSQLFARETHLVEHNRATQLILSIYSENIAEAVDAIMAELPGFTNAAAPGQ